MRQGVRCGKVAVVCRDISKYRAAVKYEFRMADIPLYCDEPTTPEFSAPATAVRCLLALARGAELTEQLTTLAKTGLCALTEEEVCALENYAYTWSPNAAAWRAPSRRTPGLRRCGAHRRGQRKPCPGRKGPRPSHHRRDGLRAKLRSANAEQMSRALYFCLKELGAEDAQAAQVEASGSSGASPPLRKPPGSGTWSWACWTRWRACWAARASPSPSTKSCSGCCCARPTSATFPRRWTRGTGQRRQDAP